MSHLSLVSLLRIPQLKPVPRSDKAVSTTEHFNSRYVVKHSDPPGPALSWKAPFHFGEKCNKLCITETYPFKNVDRENANK